MKLGKCLGRLSEIVLPKSDLMCGKVLESIARRERLYEDRAQRLEMVVRLGASKSIGDEIRGQSAPRWRREVLTDLRTGRLHIAAPSDWKSICWDTDEEVESQFIGIMMRKEYGISQEALEACY